MVVLEPTLTVTFSIVPFGYRNPYNTLNSLFFPILPDEPTPTTHYPPYPTLDQTSDAQPNHATNPDGMFRPPAGPIDR